MLFLNVLNKNIYSFLLRFQKKESVISNFLLSSSKKYIKLRTKQPVV